MTNTIKFNESKVPVHKQHWRKLAGKEFLVGEELDGKDVTLIIKTISAENMQSQKGIEKKVVATFESTDRKIILNVTNMRRISEITGSGFIQDWIGKKITFTTETVSAFGKTTQALRVKQ